MAAVIHMPLFELRNEGIVTTRTLCHTAEEEFMTRDSVNRLALQLLLDLIEECSAYERRKIACKSVARLLYPHDPHVERIIQHRRKTCHRYVAAESIA